MEEHLKTFKSLSEATRIRILAILHHGKEVCVSDIVDALQESQYKISRHLKILQDANLVVSDRKGRWIYYQLNKNKFHFNDILLNAIKHISSDIIKQDLNRLQKKISDGYSKRCTTGNERPAL